MKTLICDNLSRFDLNSCSIFDFAVEKLLIRTNILIGNFNYIWNKM